MPTHSTILHRTIASVRRTLADLDRASQAIFRF